MSENQADTITSRHAAMLVAWGQFGQSIGMKRSKDAVLLR
jgi:hypothetical protein